MSRGETIGHEEMHCRWLTSRSLSQRKGSQRGRERSQPSLVNMAFNYVLNRHQSLYACTMPLYKPRWTRVCDTAPRREPYVIIMRLRRAGERKKVASPSRETSSTAAGHWTHWVNRVCSVCNAKMLGSVAFTLSLSLSLSLSSFSLSSIYLQRATFSFASTKRRIWRGRLRFFFCHVSIFTVGNSEVNQHESLFGQDGTVCKDCIIIIN